MIRLRLQAIYENTKFSNPSGKSDIIQVPQEKFTWMEEYCAEYMNIVGLSSGNDCDSGFVSWFKHAVGCYHSQSYYRAIKKTLSLPSLVDCCLKSLPLHQWSK